MDSAILCRRVPLLFLNWICSSSVIESLLSLVRPLSAETVWMEWRRLGNMMIDSEDVPLRLKRYTLSFIILYDFWLKEKYLYSSVGYRQEPQRSYQASEEVKFPIEYYFCLQWKNFRYIHFPQCVVYICRMYQLPGTKISNMLFRIHIKKKTAFDCKLIIIFQDFFFGINMNNLPSIIQRMYKHVTVW